MRDEPEKAPKLPSETWRKWVVIGAVAMAVAFIGHVWFFDFEGVNVIVAGETVTYRPSRWWLAIFAVPAGSMVLMGIAVVTLPHALARLIGGVVLLSAVSVAATAPTVLIGELTVTPQGFTHTAGSWWDPETRTVRFDSLASMQVVSQRRDGQSPSFVLECRRRDGEIVRIPKSTVLKTGLPVILVRAAASSVIVLP